MSDTDTPAKPGRKVAAKKAAKGAAGKARAPRKSGAKAAARETASAAPVPPNAQSDTPAAEPRSPLFRVPMPVRWRDLDAFNHVNNSKYLSYLEEARLHWMIGIPGKGLDDHVAPVVAAAQLNYRRPIGWPAQVVIELFVERLGNTSLTIGHRIVDAADAGVLYCDGHVVMVWIDRDSGAAAALPAPVRDACTG